jgi:hypothetical protein
VRGDDGEARRGLDRAGALAADGQRVAGALVGMAEDLRGDPDVERDDAVEREDGDPVHLRIVPGRIAAMYGSPATGGPAPGARA